MSTEIGAMPDDEGDDVDPNLGDACDRQFRDWGLVTARITSTPSS
jgi:hypothetical protein